MGNRRRPKRPDLNLQHAALHDAAERLRQEGLLVDSWSDEPHHDFPEATMEWIIGKLDDPQVNAYHCTTCDQVVITIDKHPGATPAFVSHGMFGVECDGETRSAWYRVDQTYAVWATHEWYRPSRDELDEWRRTGTLDTALRSERITAQAMVDHVEKGGLALRRIPEGSGQHTIVDALARIGRSTQPVVHVGGRRTGKTAAMEAAKAAHEHGEQQLQQARGYVTDDDVAEDAGFKADELEQRRKQRETGGYRG